MSRSRKKRRPRQESPPAQPPPSGPVVSPPPLPAWKTVLFSVVTVVGFFALLEGALALWGVEPVLYSEDPYVGFAGNVPLFVADPHQEGMLHTAPNKIRWFNEQSFPRKKPGNTYRIFSLGGSTTYGRPYRDEASFSGWLREFLAAADPSREWEVINAGGVSYASYRVAALVEELIEYDPDLFIIYSGHNEFLERRTYSGIIETPQAITDAGAIRRYRAALRLQPDYLEPHYSLGVALLSRGKTSEAIGQFEKVLELKPGHHAARISLSSALLSLDRAEEAVATLREAARISPNSADVTYNLGIALQAAGHVDEAMKEYRATIRLDPSRAGAHRNLGVLLAMRGDAGPAARRCATLPSPGPGTDSRRDQVEEE